jgi:hypothetical protein
MGVAEQVVANKRPRGDDKIAEPNHSHYPAECGLVHLS